MKNPNTINIIWEDGSGTDEDVETWWYDGNDLFVEYLDGSVTKYPCGNVID
ncbi:hypothetical protein [Halorubrum halodurans]|uniref:hypothetical protein n=1 Tax=Halorubrum halodurans TaxID=1383851 RepID=UPI0015C59F48|nr:hypothetical protein [Halorubrum halodurans]